MVALNGLEHDLAKLDAAFDVAQVTLPISDAARFAGIVEGRASSLLEQHASSLSNWGAGTVQTIRNNLALSLATGETADDAIDRIAAATDSEWWRVARVVVTECLPGNAVVSGVVVRAVHRRWYEGPMVEIVTEGGRKLSATPNHPMFARRGWIGAGALQKGDDLVCYTGEQHPLTSSDENVAGGPTTIAEIFDATAAVGVRERRRTAQPDFHGDGRDGEVDIFSTNRELVYGRFAALDQPLLQDILSPPDLAASRFCHVCKVLLAGGSQEGSHGLWDPTHLDPSFAQALAQHFVAGAEYRGELVNTLAGEVASRELGKVANRYARAGWGAHQPAPTQKLDERLFGHRSACGRLAVAQPTDVKFDRILDVRVRAFSGHVFNLTTPQGYYSYGGVYTGNTSWAANATTADGIHAAKEAVPDMMQRWVEYCSDETGEPLDNRVGVDSIALHGQVTPTGGMFVMPDTAPHPDARGNTDVPDSLVGQSWPHPPDRPHDRALIQGFRKAWGGVIAYRLIGGERAPV